MNLDDAKWLREITDRLYLKSAITAEEGKRLRSIARGVAAGASRVVNEGYCRAVRRPGVPK